MCMAQETETHEIRVPHLGICFCACSGYCTPAGLPRVFPTHKGQKRENSQTPECRAEYASPSVLLPLGNKGGHVLMTYSTASPARRSKHEVHKTPSVGAESNSANCCICRLGSHAWHRQLGESFPFSYTIAWMHLLHGPDRSLVLIHPRIAPKEMASGRARPKGAILSEVVRALCDARWERHCRSGSQDSL